MISRLRIFRLKSFIIPSLRLSIRDLFTRQPILPRSVFVASSGARSNWHIPLYLTISS